MGTGHSGSRDDAVHLRSPLRDRDHAARLLARRLTALHGQCPLVLGLPGGGVHMGRVISRVLDGELDVVLARTLGAPHNPDLPIGAIDEGGRIHLNVAARHLCGDDRHVRHEASRQLGVMSAVRPLYRAIRERADPSGRAVVVVDDGLGCPELLLASLAAVRGLGPRWLVAALGVASERTRQHAMQVADQIECLHQAECGIEPHEFFGECSTVSDADAAESLAGYAMYTRPLPFP